MRPLLVLRAEPGASQTAARARAMGLEPVVAPLFTIRPLAWEPPDDFDAVLLTSANAARALGDKDSAIAARPCYVTGEATAAAARDAGLRDIRIGAADGAAALDLARREGRRRILHPCGREHIAFPGVERRIVYAADALDTLPRAARDALARGAVALVHSPRGAALFRALAGPPGSIAIAAISPAAAQGAGEGWASVAVAARPRDEALLEVAAKLCQTAPQSRAEAGR